MSRISAGLRAPVLAFVVVGLTASGAQAQGSSSISTACARPCCAATGRRSTRSYKAYSAASLTLARKEDSTKAVAERMSKSPATTVPQTPLPNVTYAVGGVTIMAGSVPVGAIGVSGAPGGQLDEDCIGVALAKIRDKIK